MPTKRDYWSHHITAWSGSGTTQAAWCREHGISLSSFTYWRAKLGTPAELAATLPLRITASCSMGHCEIRLTSGVSVSVPANDPVWLARLLRELGAC